MRILSADVKPKTFVAITSDSYILGLKLEIEEGMRENSLHIMLHIYYDWSFTKKI